MNIKKFESMYGHKGGVVKLKEMMDALMTQSEIGDHFGVSAKRIRQWTMDFFGKSYDPRAQRKDLAIKKMIEFAKKNSIDKFREIYRKSDYYSTVLKKCIKMKIYDIKRQRHSKSNK